MSILIKHANLFDGENDVLHEDMDILVEGDRIIEVSDTPLKSDASEIVDLSGQTLMPGLIDAHVHVYASELNLSSNTRRPWTYLAHYAGNFLGHMLDNGYTSIRDMGGADYGLSQAINAGLVKGPRLFYGGRLLSQTGGHADWRPQFEDDPTAHICNCGAIDQKLAVVADGVSDVVKAAREELRRGASHIKFVASGGVASPTDPVDNLQYRDDEISAMVEEASRHDAYVAAHCHPKGAIRRCVELGVRSIEHGTLIDKETAEFVANSDAYIVPTMATIFALADDGERLGLPPVSVTKVKEIVGEAIGGMEIMKAAGVRVGFGSDLLGPHYKRQGTEFTLRKGVFTPFEILKSATSTNAEILNVSGQIGCVKPGAFADLIAVKGNPLVDIDLLSKGAESLSMVMKNGQIHKS